MVYNKKLPPVRQLLSLAQHTRFPATRAAAVQVANGLGSPQTVIDFLKLFPSEETFASRDEFMTRCEELELLIGQERAMPTEVLRSPQD